MEDVAHGPAAIGDAQFMLPAEDHGAGGLQCRAALQKQQSGQVEPLVASGRISLIHQLCQLFATNLDDFIAAFDNDLTLVGMHLIYMRMKGTEHIAIPPALILLGQKSFQLFHKGLKKRTGTGKKCPR